MSARKINTHSLLGSATQTKCLDLPADTVRIRKSGFEFRSVTPFTPWTEMTVGFQMPGSAKRVQCNAVVVACSGTPHAGYAISMLFTNLSRLTQAQLQAIS